MFQEHGFSTIYGRQRKDPGPRFLQQVARWLGAMVLPAAPAPTNGCQLSGSARRCVYESLDILKKHYISVKEEMLLQLTGINLEEGK